MVPGGDRTCLDHQMPRSADPRTRKSNKGKKKKEEIKEERVGARLVRSLARARHTEVDVPSVVSSL